MNCIDKMPRGAYLFYLAVRDTEHCGGVFGCNVFVMIERSQRPTGARGLKNIHLPLACRSLPLELDFSMVHIFITTKLLKHL